MHSAHTYTVRVNERSAVPEFESYARNSFSNLFYLRRTKRVYKLVSMHRKLTANVQLRGQDRVVDSALCGLVWKAEVRLALVFRYVGDGLA